MDQAPSAFFCSSILTLETLAVSEIPDQRRWQLNKPEDLPTHCSDSMEDAVSSTLRESLKRCSNLKAKCHLLNQEM